MLMGGNGGGVGILFGCCISGFIWLGDIELGYDLGSFARCRLFGGGDFECCVYKFVGGCGLFGDNLGLVAKGRFRLAFGSCISFGCFLEK